MNEMRMRDDQFQDTVAADTLWLNRDRNTFIISDKHQCYLQQY